MKNLRDLFVKGMQTLYPHVSANEIVREIACGVIANRYRVFIQGDAAFCILALPQNPFETPQVLHFYSEKPALRHSLVARVLDFVREKGYNSLLAVNSSGTTDDIWTRAFRHEGWEIKPVRTVFEFKAVQNG